MGFFTGNPQSARMSKDGRNITDALRNQTAGEFSQQQINGRLNGQIGYSTETGSSGRIPRRLRVPRTAAAGLTRCERVAGTRRKGGGVVALRF